MINNRKIQLQVEEYKKELKGLNAVRFDMEWIRVMLCLNPNSQIKKKERKIDSE